MAAARELHRNVLLLTQAVPTSKDFDKYFKEGMFDKSNSMALIHVSHYLLSIYDETRFKRYIEWPILDRRCEDKYRSGTKDFLTVVFKENEDFGTPIIQKSHLVTPQGRIIINIMRLLSQIVLRTYLIRMGVHVLEVPKQEFSRPITNIILNAAIERHQKSVKELDQKYTAIEVRAKEQAENTAKDIVETQKQIFEDTERLQKVAVTTIVNSEAQKYLTNLTNTDVIPLWVGHIEKGMTYLEEHQARLEKIEKKSTTVNNLVLSLFSESRKVLDGGKLPKINTARLMELPLDPETQVALHHLYVDNKLVLNNMLIVSVAMLRYYLAHLQKTGFPDVTDCNQQIQVSTEDLQAMGGVMDQQRTKITQLLNDLQRENQTLRRKINLEAFYEDNYILKSELLKASPKTTINIDYQYDNIDIQGRLKLTPVEGQHKALFARYKKVKNHASNETPTRPKIMVSRLNLDDTLMSNNSRMSSTMSIGSSSTKFNPALIQSRVGGKFARLFNAGQAPNRPALPSAKPLTSSSLIEGINGNIYNISDLRTQLANTSSVSVNLELPLSRSTHDSSARSSLVLSNLDKPTFNSTALGSDLQTISETPANPVLSPKLTENNEKPVKTRRLRRSIGDIVDRYKKIRDQSITIPHFRFDDDDD